jgi:hypothetical protein
MYRKGKMAFKAIIGASCVCLSVVSFNTEAALVGRDLDGDFSTYEDYYDTESDLTWLADANYAKTSRFDIDGKMNWDKAISWARLLDIGGVRNWRLPDAYPSCSSNLNCTGYDFDYAHA